MRTVMVVAPHPDDEVLGCGGTLLKHGASGDQLHWLLATGMSPSAGYSRSQIESRESEIAKVSNYFGFSSVIQLGFSPAQLDTVPMSELVSALAQQIRAVSPEIIYLPFPGDVHTDHKVIFEACASVCKVFRAPSIRSVIVYETPSETDFSIDPVTDRFSPNLWVDISDYLDAKIEVMNYYQSEMAPFPFPRSEEVIRSLARLRGSQSGVSAAEAFMIMKELR